MSFTTTGRPGGSETLWMANPTHSTGENYTATSFGFLTGFRESASGPYGLPWGRKACEKSQREGIAGPSGRPDWMTWKTVFWAPWVHFFSFSCFSKLHIWLSRWKPWGIKGRADSSLLKGCSFTILFCSSRSSSEQDEPSTHSFRTWVPWQRPPPAATNFISFQSCHHRQSHTRHYNVTLWLFNLSFHT